MTKPMRVRIAYTVDLTDEVHKALENHYGEVYKTRREAAAALRSFMKSSAASDLETVMYDLPG